jgi:hypothetical protein
MPLRKVLRYSTVFVADSFVNRETTSDVRLVTLNGSDPELLPKFVAAAHEHVRFNSLAALLSLIFFTESESFGQCRWLDRQLFLVVQRCHGRKSVGLRLLFSPILGFLTSEQNFVCQDIARLC